MQAVIEEIRKDQPVAHEVAFASVLFCDVVSFTTLAARIAPEDLVAMLNVIFSTFDALSTVHNVYKVETIGKLAACVYICECGMHVCLFVCQTALVLLFPCMLLLMVYAVSFQVMHIWLAAASSIQCRTTRII